MIENKLEELKKEYKSIAIPDYLISNGWLDLSLKLPEKNKSLWHMFLVRGLVFASLVLFLGVGLVGVSQASKPGDLLFPVKEFSEKVAIKAGVANPEISVIRRANDLIDQSQKNQDAAQKASQEYQKTLEQSKQDAEKSGDTKQFKQTLEKQEQKFTDAQKNNHGSTELNRAVEETQRVNGEVKGEKDSNRNINQDRNSNSEHSNGGQERNSGSSRTQDRSGD